MKVLVTGGAGFIGSHIVQALVNEGVTVKVLDNFATGCSENLADVRSRIELIEGDIRDPEAIALAVKGVEGVFHLAALPSVPRSFQDPIGTTSVNCGGTISVLEAARKAGVKKVIFSSSSSVYGDIPVEIKHEKLSPAPISPYAVSKLSGEIFCRNYWKNYGMETIALRYFNIFGPRQNPRSQYAAVIPLFITAILGGQNPVIFGDGTQSRDFTYVDNVVRANLAAFRAPASAYGKVFNVACGGEISLLALIDRLGFLAKSKVKPRFDPARPGDVKHSRADISRAAKLLGYEPVVLVEEGLKKTYQHFQSLLNQGSNNMEE